MIQFVISLIITGIVVGTAFGAISSRVSDLETCMVIAKADHERVLVIGTKLDIIIEDLREIKITIEGLKEIRSELRELKARLK